SDLAWKHPHPRMGVHGCTPMTSGGAWMHPHHQAQAHPMGAHGCTPKPHKTPPQKRTHLPKKPLLVRVRSAPTSSPPPARTRRLGAHRCTTWARMAAPQTPPGGPLDPPQTTTKHPPPPPIPPPRGG